MTAFLSYQSDPYFSLFLLPVQRRQPVYIGAINTTMYDLFGEIVVTTDDIAQWVAALAPAYMSSDRAFERYVRLWDVAGKVRRAKAAGTFESTIEAALARRSHIARRFGFTS